MKSIRYTVVSIWFASSAIAASAAEPAQCAHNDTECFEHTYTRACGASNSNLDSCLNWVAVLEKQVRSGNENAEFMLGLAYKRLADETAVSAPEESRNHHQRAKQAFESLLERNPRHAPVLVALGGMTEDRDEQIRLLRKGTELDASDITALQLLSTVLIQSGDPQELREAADLMKKAYDIQIGANKWYLASSAYSLYQMAGAHSEAKAFKQAVTEAFDPPELEDLSVEEPERIAEELLRSCDRYALPVVGAGTCMQNISTVVQHVTTADRGSGARTLADAAARAMLEVTLERPFQDGNRARQETLARWLESLMQASYESSAIHLSYAEVTMGEVRLRALQRAAQLDPKNGKIAFRLGMEYSQLAQWKSAVEELKRAQAHAPDFQQSAIEHQLRVAQAQSGEASQ